MLIRPPITFGNLSCKKKSHGNREIQKVIECGLMYLEGDYQLYLPWPYIVVVNMYVEH